MRFGRRVATGDRGLLVGHNRPVVALFFTMSTPSLFFLLCGLAGMSIVVGVRLGGWLRERRPERHGSIGVIQAALFGLIGLLLAFGLSMAVDRYEHRRASTVEEANAIGTVILRAQLLAEPFRSESIAVLQRYTEVSVEFSETRPGSAANQLIDAELGDLFDELWSIAARVDALQPTGNLSRLFVEALNEANDAHGVRVAGLDNHVPNEVAAVILFASCAALMALGLHLAMVGRGYVSSLVAALVVVGVLFVSYDLDRPTRGRIKVPDSALVSLRDQLAPD